MNRESIKNLKKVDVSECDNEALARRYNAIVNFMNEKTWFEDGCCVGRIDGIEYVSEDRPRYREYIVIKVTIMDSHTIWIKDAKELRIDRKYNSLVRIHLR